MPGARPSFAPASFFRIRRRHAPAASLRAHACFLLLRFSCGFPARNFTLNFPCPTRNCTPNFSPRTGAKPTTLPSNWIRPATAPYTFSAINFWTHQSVRAVTKGRAITWENDLQLPFGTLNFSRRSRRRGPCRLPAVCGFPACSCRKQRPTDNSNRLGLPVTGDTHNLNQNPKP